MPRDLPYEVALEPGTYYWCSCGRSAQEPFCDGSHKDTGKEPVIFEIRTAAREALCGCGRTKSPPYCDGTHAR